MTSADRRRQGPKQLKRQEAGELPPSAGGRQEAGAARQARTCFVFKRSPSIVPQVTHSDGAGASQLSRLRYGSPRGDDPTDKTNTLSPPLTRTSLPPSLTRRLPCLTLLLHSLLHTSARRPSPPIPLTTPLITYREAAKHGRPSTATRLFQRLPRSLHAPHERHSPGPLFSGAGSETSTASDDAAPLLSCFAFALSFCWSTVNLIASAAARVRR